MPTQILVSIKATSFNLNTLNFFYLFLKKLFLMYNVKTNLVFLKTKKKKITLLKSAHVHKKAREQFQMLKFTSLITFYLPSCSTFQVFPFLKLNTPKNIDVKFLFRQNLL
jgi:ribosomal protein S10